MATICNDLPPRAIEAICVTHGYQATVDDGAGNQIPNTQTKAQFVKLVFAKYAKNVTVEYESQLAASTQRTTTNSEVNVT